MSALREMRGNYLTLRRALGYKLRTDGAGLMSFVSFMEEAQADHITTVLALAWATQPTSVQPTRWAQRLSYVRSFARYCSAINTRTEVPPAALLPFPHRRPRPDFFTDENIDHLLQGAGQWPGTDGLANHTYYCLLFINAHGKRLGYDAVLDMFHRLTAGLPRQPGRARPRFHDLRHRFALLTVLHWYCDGEDVERKLPVLSAFLGHVEVGNTSWYLSACPELREAAKARLERHWEPTP